MEIHYELIITTGRRLPLRDHTVLPVTRHRRTHPALTPASEGWYRLLDLPTPEGWKAELT